MKTKSFIWLMALVMSLAFEGCKGNDKNNPSSGGALIGTWKAQVMSNCVIYDRYQVDHTLIHIEVWDGYDIDKDVNTWKIEGDKLLTTDEKGRIETCTYSVNGDKLIRTEGLSITYNRCSDSEMDYYLEKVENKGKNDPDPVDPIEPNGSTPDTPSSDCNNF